MAITTLIPQRTGWLRPLILTLAALLVLAALVFMTAPPARRLLANPTGQPAVVGDHTIDVLGDRFQNHIYAPPVVRVPVGTTVTWTFNDRGVSGAEDRVPHNVIGAGWGSPVLTEGSFRHTFTEPGRYPYTCTLHAGMDGVVEVVDS